MYNLNYTYLTDLEVDTRKTFSDLSDDLLLVNCKQDSLDKKINMQTLITSWQDFFWKTSNENKHNLNVTFTDISIDHSGLEDLNDDEMMSYGELIEFFDELDSISAWAGNRNLTQLCCVLMDSIDMLHDRLSSENLYPKGSIVIYDSETDPSTQISSLAPTLKWKSIDPAYFAENLKSTKIGTEISNMGYHIGKVNKKEYTKLNQAKVTPEIENGVVPTHEHKLEFDPKNGADSGGGEGEEIPGLVTFMNVKPGSNSSPYSGINTEFESEGYSIGLIVSKQASQNIGSSGSCSAEFSVDKSSASPKLSSVNVAPKTYPMNAKVWERT